MGLIVAVGDREFGAAELILVSPVGLYVLIKFFIVYCSDVPG